MSMCLVAFRKNLEKVSREEHVEYALMLAGAFSSSIIFVLGDG